MNAETPTPKPASLEKSPTSDDMKKEKGCVQLKPSGWNHIKLCTVHHNKEACTATLKHILVDYAIVHVCKLCFDNDKTPLKKCIVPKNMKKNTYGKSSCGIVSQRRN